jgi:hypothetical protein
LNKEIKTKDLIIETKSLRLKELQKQLEGQKYLERRQLSEEIVIEKTEQPVAEKNAEKPLDRNEPIVVNKSVKSLRKIGSCHCQCIII